MAAEFLDSYHYRTVAEIDVEEAKRPRNINQKLVNVKLHLTWSVKRAAEDFTYRDRIEETRATPPAKGFRQE